MRYLIVLLILCTIVLPACAADQSNTVELTKGGGSLAFAPTLKLGSLDSTWMGFSVSPGESQMGGYLQAIAGMFGGSQGRYYTRLQIVQFGGETYLVAYGLKAKPIDPTIFKSPEPPRPEKPTADSIITLSLIHLKTAGSLTDIHPFNLDDEVKTSEEPSLLQGLMGAAMDESKAKSVATESLANLKQLSLALMTYSMDSDGKLPAMTDMDAVKKTISAYVSQASIFVNPITKQPYLVNSALSMHKLAQIKYPGSTVVFYEDSPAADGTRGVALLDGSAKRVDESHWAKLKKISKIK